MKIEWRTVTGSQAEKPEAIDKTSSSQYVYLRRNIERITQTDEKGGSVLLWRYEEAEVTQKEYEQYDTIATDLLQSEINNLDSKQTKQNLVIQANMEYLAMMSGTELEV